MTRTNDLPVRRSMNDDQEQILKLLDGALSDDEERALRARIAASESLAGELERLAAIRGALRESTTASFPLGFTDRVMRRLGEEESPEVALYSALQWLFRRAAVAGLVVAGIIGTLNIMEYTDEGVSGSAVESLFGLPSVTLDDAIAAYPVIDEGIEE
jgi:anti-sigma factor RsiW